MGNWFLTCSDCRGASVLEVWGCDSCWRNCSCCASSCSCSSSVTTVCCCELRHSSCPTCVFFCSSTLDCDVVPSWRHSCISCVTLSSLVVFLRPQVSYVLLLPVSSCASAVRLPTDVVLLVYRMLAWPDWKSFLCWDRGLVKSETYDVDRLTDVVETGPWGLEVMALLLKEFVLDRPAVLLFRELVELYLCCSTPLVILLDPVDECWTKCGLSFSPSLLNNLSVSWGLWYVVMVKFIGSWFPGTPVLVDISFLWSFQKSEFSNSCCFMFCFWDSLSWWHTCFVLLLNVSMPSSDKAEGFLLSSKWCGSNRGLIWVTLFLWIWLLRLKLRDSWSPLVGETVLQIFGWGSADKDGSRNTWKNVYLVSRAATSTVH